MSHEPYETCDDPHDPFFVKPIRTHKGGGTRCNSCEIIDPCTDAGKCIHPLICVTLDNYEIADCDPPEFISEDPATGGIYYNCTLHGFNLSVRCAYEVIDFMLTYEIIYDVQYAVLRSEALGFEKMVEFTEEFNARCPTFDFGVLSTRPYDMVSIGQQMCIDSGPDDCTGGRCLPRFLCADIYTVEQPEEPFHTTLEWYTNDVVKINDICCCNANVFPERLIARVVNFSAGCACIAPQRFPSMFYPVEHAAAELNDPGSLLHLRHRIASYEDKWATGYPFVTLGSNVWVSEGQGTWGDLVQLCPAPRQIITPDTRYIYGRMILWCDVEDGKFKAAFETIDFSAYGFDAATDANIPFDLYSPYNTVTVMDDLDILACNPFAVRCRGIFEDINCQTLQSVDGVGDLEIIVNEFQGWVGENPMDGGGKIIVYSERVNQAAPAQTIFTDCWPKLHMPDASETTFKGRGDLFYIDKPWPLPVWEGMSIFPNDFVGYHFINRIDFFPRKCTGCEPNIIEDPYNPRVPCCPEPMPSVLYATAVNQFDCPCADGTVIPLVYNTGTRSWIGGGIFGSGTYCECRVDFEVICRRATGAFVFELNVRFNGVFFGTYSPGEPMNREFACDPFLWITKTSSNNECCHPSFAASQFYWVITE